MTEEATNIVQEKVEDKTVELSLQDVQLVLNILNVCNRRGAFVLDELELIGALNKKLKALVPPPEQPSN